MTIASRATLFLVNNIVKCVSCSWMGCVCYAAVFTQRFILVLRIPSNVDTRKKSWPISLKMLSQCVRYCGLCTVLYTPRVRKLIDTILIYAKCYVNLFLEFFCWHTRRSTQPPTVCGMVKWVSAFGLSNNDGDGHSCLQAGQWLKSVGLVQRSAAVWRCSAFIAWTGCTAPL